jgi:hypothetical protein
MKKFAGFLSLNLQDWVRGLIMAVIGAVLAVIQSSISADVFTIDWSNIWHVALIAGTAYILKQLGTSIPKVVEIDPAKTAVVDTTTKEVISETPTAPAPAK